ncbi:hypothetical protein Nepgr_033843 [Nepenthes gracilis]|uniref:Uncharacterized protein n=1 Tax=Nepenthes gracilis TaxID=150966 RepID=A0AAD3TMS0_NEPGR|nr:hypothetical protein Nepgr_033843 [Nepenthes gracilis]
MQASSTCILIPQEIITLSAARLHQQPFHPAPNFRASKICRAISTPTPFRAQDQNDASEHMSRPTPSTSRPCNINGMNQHTKMPTKDQQVAAETASANQSGFRPCSWWCCWNLLLMLEEGWTAALSRVGLKLGCYHSLALAASLRDIWGG